LVSGSFPDHTIKIWDMCNMECIKTNFHYQFGLAQLDFWRVAYGTPDNKIQIWDLEDFEESQKQPFRILHGHNGKINQMVKIEGGFASISEDMAIKIWK